MNRDPVWSLQIDFRHPGEAVVILKSIIAAYQQVRPQADAAGIPELSEHFARRLDDLDDLGNCLAEAEFDLASDEAMQQGHA